MKPSSQSSGPSSSKAEERRSEIRIREAADKAVRADLVLDEHQRWKNLSITNLSQHGVSLEIPLLRAHLLHPKQKVVMKLRMGKEGVELGGTIVHCHPPQVGVEFFEIEANQWSYSDSILSRMIFSIERKHLRRKAYQSTL